MNMQESYLRALVITCLLVVLTITPVWAESDTTPEEPHKWLREISLVTGYGAASLEKKSGAYEIIPVLPQFGFDINPLLKKMNITPRGTLEFIIEPLVNVVISPDSNAEIGFSLLLNYSDNITSRIAPYIEGGLGAIHTTQNTHEQGTQYNFLTQVGAGLQFFLNDTFALKGGYRFRHMSNAGIDDDNSGINHHFVLVGLSYFFK
jgi:lipid A 3-O-deacylase